MNQVKTINQTISVLGSFSHDFWKLSLFLNVGVIISDHILLHYLEHVGSQCTSCKHNIAYIKHFIYFHFPLEIILLLLHYGAIKVVNPEIYIILNVLRQIAFLGTLIYIYYLITYNCECFPTLMKKYGFARLGLLLLI